MDEIDDDRPDASLDKTLRVSPFLTTSLFDIIEGSSVLVLELIDLLIASGALSGDQVQEMFDRLEKRYAERHQADLAAFTVRTAAAEFGRACSLRVHVVERQLAARRSRERSARHRRGR